jgi:hypothetical protein
MHELGAETVLTVKGNQPTLYADLATYFADPQARCLQAETVDRRRGRTEAHTIKVSTEMNAVLAPAWPFVAQVVQLTRTVTKVGQTTNEVVYLITPSRPAKRVPRPCSIPTEAIGASRTAPILCAMTRRSTMNWRISGGRLRAVS